jgi:hypothetical protein
MGGFWPRIYVVEKGHARDIYFLLHCAKNKKIHRVKSTTYLEFVWVVYFTRCISFIFRAVCCRVQSLGCQLPFECMLLLELLASSANTQPANP